MASVNHNAPQLTVGQSHFQLLKSIESCLQKCGIAGYLVGGFVRDSILERDIEDIDIAVAADSLGFSPELAHALNGKYIPMDKENKVARIVLKETSHGAVRHIDVSTIINDIEDDLSRRDFTLNAMAVPLKDIESAIGKADIIDPFGGLSDVQQKILRVTCDSAFEADPLRLLRAARLSAELGFAIEDSTEELVKKHARMITAVSGERIREELLKLLSLPKTGDLFLYLEEMGLLSAIMPEILPSKGLEQPSEHYWDVFTHSIKTIDAVSYILRRGDWQYSLKALEAVPWSDELEAYFNQKLSAGSTRLLLLKLTALLHDIAKPKMKFIDENGKIRFYGHPKEGAPMAAEIMERLRFSSREIMIVEEVTRHHLRPTQMTQMGIVTDHAIYRYFRDVGEVAIDTLFFTLADHLAARGPTLDENNWIQHNQTVAYILEKHREQENKTAFPRLLSGEDIMAEFGLEPGPKIGELLEAVREAQATGEVSNKADAVDCIRRILAQ
ncbi:MAG: CCA tRNA nucleotidyltransferase [Dehalococcoidales bacterium]|nr:CCA tRNA nucleotidyltransferase [Dehalococcoidales bacterium]